ncbi:MAG TPA: hypothetical protein VFI73_02055 [Candidatus Nitrosopolaris sp.]|nr:hypothetical protein [Candidatus Nitrosopolaris sp.]
MRLTQYGKLNWTTLNYTELIHANHKEILEDIEQKGIIKRREEPRGNKKNSKI